MLAVESLAINETPFRLGNPFSIAHLELIDSKSLKVWFTRPVANGTTISNYTIPGVTVVLAQYESTQIIRLYLSSDLIAGQWTLTVGGTVVSDDADALSLSGDEAVFDLVENQPQDQESPQVGLVASFVPKRLRSKKIVADILAAYQTADDLVSDQARAAFDQYYLSTASGKYLTTRAKDKGVSKPDKLGMQDEDFAQLAISLVNNKLTNVAILNILEKMFGPEAVHAFVETTLEGPFRVFDEGTLTLCVDGKTTIDYIVEIERFRNPLEVTATELATDLNSFFDNNVFPAFAEVLNNKVRIYSNTKGLGSSISVTGGTLQNYLQFNSSVFTTDDPEDALAVTWTITNPEIGVVRLAPSVWPEAFSSLHIGDYITITGENFPEDLRGSYPIVNVNYSYDVLDALVQWVEIESDYTVS